MEPKYRRSSHHGNKINQPTNPLPKGQACVRCREHRIKCDGNPQGCNSCKRAARHANYDHSKGCSYAPRQAGERRRAARKVKPANAKSTRYLDGVDSASSSASTSEDSSAPSSSASSPSSTSGQEDESVPAAFKVDLASLSISASAASVSASSSKLALPEIPLYLLTPGSSLRRQLEQILGIEAPVAPAVLDRADTHIDVEMLSLPQSRAAPLPDFKAMVDFNNSLVDTLLTPRLSILGAAQQAGPASTSRPLFFDVDSSLCSSPSQMTTPELPSYFHPDAPKGEEYEKRTGSRSSSSSQTSLSNSIDMRQTSLPALSSNSSSSTNGSNDSSPFPTFTFTNEDGSAPSSITIPNLWPEFPLSTFSYAGAASTSTAGISIPRLSQPKQASSLTLTIEGLNTLLTPGGADWSCLKTPTANDERTPGASLLNSLIISTSSSSSDFVDVENWLGSAMRY